PMDPLGLKHALRSSVLAFRELTHVDLAFEDPVPELRLSAAQEFQLLRIVQEALANVAKHAQAQRAWLTIHRHAGRVDVVVEDDGNGLPEPPAADGGSHYGLEIMRQRAASLGGTLDVGPRAGGGTRVHLSFPTEAKPVAVQWTT
ncbi:MAG TPA: ATP-binding protein, partial [Burkholderiaceae bacterium]|nr:ATP-binding protein [Burkholderiaceae bacterium]